jgi:hypothetical protein
MPIQISCSAPPFVAQKSRKFLVSAQISLFGVSNVPTSCRLRVRVLSSSVLGALTIQDVPNMWDVVSLGQEVQSATPFDPNGVVTNVVAFPAFFDSRNPTSTDTYNGMYQIDLIDASLGASTTPIATLQFQLTGTANPAQAVNVAFALDHGSSMATPDSSGVIRLQRLKTAFMRGLTLLRSSDSVGVTAYGNVNCVPIPPVPCLPASADHLSDVRAFATALTLDESLPTKKWQQLGLDAGRALSPTATVVLITDGVNKNPSGQSITQPTLPTSALIVSEEPHSPPAAAPQIVSPGGHYAIAAPQALGDFAIEKLLTQVLIGLAGNVFIDDPQGSLKPGESLAYAIPEIAADREVHLILFSNDAEVLEVHKLLGSHSKPDSKEQSRPDSKEQHCGHGHEEPEPEIIRKKDMIIYRYTPPKKRGDHPFLIPTASVHRKPGSGTGLGMGAVDVHKKLVHFNLLMVAHSDLMLDAQVTSAGTTVGSDLLFSAVLSEGGHAWDFDETFVWVQLTHPDGFQQRLDLEKEGNAPGRYQATLRSFRTGTYTAHFIATGRPFLQADTDARRFRRECVRSVAVFPPRDCCQPQESGYCFDP